MCAGIQLKFGVDFSEPSSLVAEPQSCLRPRCSGWFCYHMLNKKRKVPHKAVAEVSKIGGEVGCCESQMAE